MLTAENKAGALITAFDLEMYGYPPERMEMLFKALDTKTPDYIEEFFEFLRIINEVTLKLYLIVLENYLQPKKAVTFTF